MAVTRANAEVVTVRRLSGLMAAAGLCVDDFGANDDLADPIAWAHRMLGGTTADVTAITNAELATMVVADYNDFFRLCEYRTLANIHGNLDDVDITTGPRSEKFSQLATQVQNRMEQLLPLVTAIYKSAQLEMGYISLDIAEHSEDRL